MHYQNSLSYWKQLETEQTPLPYRAIERRLLEKMAKLLDYYDSLPSAETYGFLSTIKNLEDLPQPIDHVHSGKLQLLQTDKDVYFIGDIHSDASALDQIITQVDPYSQPCHMVFLGDYVDRGHAHLETLDKLWALKLDLPDQITLLRGNHDGGYFNDDNIILPYGLDANGQPKDYFPLYLEGLMQSKMMDRSTLDTYFKLCDALPMLIFIHKHKQWTMGVHGGLPRPNSTPPYYDYIPSLQALVMNSTLDEEGICVLDNLFWSDPTEGLDGEISKKRRFNTYEAHFKEFSEIFGITQLVRGHETVKNGHRSIYNGKVHTIFSSGHPFKDSAYGAEVEEPKVLLLGESTRLKEVAIKP